MSFDLVSLGDCTIDAFTHLHEAEVRCDENSDDCKLIMPFATKIPLEERIQFLSAGNCNNVAVASAKLGLKSAFHSVVGDDENGRFILDKLKIAGVDTSLMQIDKNNRTNFHIILSYKGERTILIYHESFEYDLKKYDTKWIYFSSVSASQVPRLMEHLSTTLKDTNLAFNPATFQIKQGLELLKPTLAQTQILFMNKEEYQTVLGAHDDHDPKSLMNKMREYCKGILVLSDGPKGSYAMESTHHPELSSHPAVAAKFGGDPRSEGSHADSSAMPQNDSAKTWFLDIPDTPVVDRTGTGDAYGAAFTSAIIKGLDIPSAMRWGTLEASFKIGNVGPQGGLLTIEELNAKLEEYKKLIPTEI